MLDIFKSWHDIKDWAEAHDLKNLVRRLQLNNDCWLSSGEFGRDQVAICDSIRYTEDEDEALEVAKQIDEASKNYLKF